MCWCVLQRYKTMVDWDGWHSPNCCQRQNRLRKGFTHNWEGLRHVLDVFWNGLTHSSQTRLDVYKTILRRNKTDFEPNIEYQHQQTRCDMHTVSDVQVARVWGFCYCFHQFPLFGGLGGAFPVRSIFISLPSMPASCFLSLLFMVVVVIVVVC